MLTLVEGLRGSGKTWFTVNILLKPEWERKVNLFPNFAMWFDDDFTNITWWHVLDDAFLLVIRLQSIDTTSLILLAWLKT